MSKKNIDVLRKVVSSEHHWKIVLLDLWQDIIGDFNVSSWIEKIENQCLFIGVEHPIWAQELTFRKNELFAKLQALSPPKKIERIAFVVKNKNSSFVPLKKQRHSSQVFYDETVSVVEQRALSSVVDAGLSVVMHDFLLRCKRYRK